MKRTINRNSIKVEARLLFLDETMFLFEGDPMSLCG